MGSRGLLGAHVRQDGGRRGVAEKSFRSGDDRRLRRKERTSRSFCIPVVLALVSISLGVLNLLPIPVLDGGHLLYYLVEAVTGKVVSDRWQLVFQRAGLACIVALSAIALFNDLARLIHF